jgi:hypothetical protein
MTLDCGTFPFGVDDVDDVGDVDDVDDVGTVVDVPGTITDPGEVITIDDGVLGVQL